MNRSRRNLNDVGAIDSCAMGKEGIRYMGSACAGDIGPPSSFEPDSDIARARFC